MWLPANRRASHTRLGTTPLHLSQRPTMTAISDHVFNPRRDGQGPEVRANAQAATRGPTSITIARGSAFVVQWRVVHCLDRRTLAVRR